MNRQGAADTRRALRSGDVGNVLGFCGALLCAPPSFVHFVCPFFR
jgi:hypothetical protein